MAGDVPPPQEEAWTRLVAIVARLRAPGGCPWDREQTPGTLTPYVIEEAHEVVEAIEAGDDAALLEELGDLLLQVVLQAQLAQEAGKFDVHDVCRRLTEKMIRRHPHVFGEERFRDMDRHLLRWEELKDAEKTDAPPSALSGVPPGLPALMRADKLQAKAARVGFEWPDLASVRAKVDEELAELEAEVTGGTPARAEEEFGDLLFALVGWARRRGIRAEEALRGADRRFTERFQTMEARLGTEGKAWSDLGIADMLALWRQAR